VVNDSILKSLGSMLIESVLFCLALDRNGAGSSKS